MRGPATHCWFGEMPRGYGNVTRAGKLRWGLGRYPKCVVDLAAQGRCYWRMDQSVSGRLELLQAVLRKSEQGLARQRQLIEDLRCDGYGTIEAEEVLLRFETAYQALLTKLNALRGEGVTG